MNELTKDQKIQVLLVELQERYNASHKIRERSIQFTLWISGMAIGIGWLLLSQKTPLSIYQRIALTVLSLTLSMGTLYFLIGLRRGMSNNREAMIRSEKALGMHTPGVFLPDIALLPAEYKESSRRWSDHFYTLYLWLILVALSLLILTWTCPVAISSSSSKIKDTKIQGENVNGKFTQRVH